MKKLSIIFLIFIISCSEDQSSSTQIQNEDKDQIKFLNKGKIHVFEYDGCEYLIYKEEIDGNSAVGMMSHKGNCKNPIHKTSTIIPNNLQ